MIKAIVFDLDDTLYPESEYVKSGFIAVGRWIEKNFGVSCFAETATELFKEGIRNQVFNVCLAKLGIAVEQTLIEELVNVYRTHQPEIALPSESIRVMTKLRESYRLGLITDGYEVSQKAKIRSLELSLFFEPQSIVVSDAIGGRKTWKPSIEPFKKLQSLFALKPDEIVYVGDNPAKDFIGARSAGWNSVRVRYPSREHSKVDAVGDRRPDLEFPNLNELLSHFSTG